MGWKGTLRSVQAAQRRAERDARRRWRQLEQQQKQLEKMEELERACYEVEVYENHIDLMMSIHKECGPLWDWEKLYSEPPPAEPSNTADNKKTALDELNSFKPGIIDRILFRSSKKKRGLAKAVIEAGKRDNEEYQAALRAYADWNELSELASRILSDDVDAYLEAIEKVDPFSEISELGSSIQFQSDVTSCVEATLVVNSETVIPAESKHLLKSGKLSTKKIPKTRFYELYQDYVCGCALRVARELFSLLPMKIVIVTATGNILNTKNGHLEEQPILSVAIPRETLDRLNFETLDPSDSMGNFVHKMKFKKTKGFEAVSKISPSELA